MKVCAIISEYNPFHMGHLYHLEKVKKIADLIVIIMSGHITQRGEAAIFDKWVRAKAALKMGADLILELPTVFSCASAERFAKGAIKIIKELNFVNFLSFGSELGNINPLIETANICTNIEKTNNMKTLLKKGYSYPKARTIAVGKNGEILKYPNNTLGIEYIKASILLNVKLNFHTIKRIGTLHESNIPNITASSRYIRNNIDSIEKIKNFIPEKIIDLYKSPIKIPENLIFNSIRTANLEKFKNLPDTTEGLYNRLFKASKKAKSLKEFYILVKTKRYQRTRLQRIAMYCLLNIKKEKLKSLPTYSHVLGFNENGKKLLAMSKKNKNFLFTTNFKKIYKHDCDSAKIDEIASNIVLLFQKDPKPCGLDFKQKPIIV